MGTLDRDRHRIEADGYPALAKRISSRRRRYGSEAITTGNPGRAGPLSAAGAGLFIAALARVVIEALGW